MTITLTELQDKLKKIDEISLMEVLEITSEDMAMRFVDRIEEKFEELVTEFEEEDDDGYIPGNEWWEREDLDILEEEQMIEIDDCVDLDINLDEDGR